MAFKSEAQAYQAIRRDIKKRIKSSQRSLTYAKWALDNNGEEHPRLIRPLMSKNIKHYNLPKISEKDSEKRILDESCNIGNLQIFLDRYKVV